MLDSRINSGIGQQPELPSAQEAAPMQPDYPPRL
jgi:hypothetical protein